MRNGRVLVLLAAGFTAAAWPLVAQTTTAKKSAYRAPRTSWGAPDIHGDYTNKDEANTPLERPPQLAGKDASAFTEADLAQLAKERSAQAQQIAGGIGGAETGAGPTHWYDHLAAKGSRPWFISDPPDGRLPAMTPQALRREAAVALLNDARSGEGRADSPDDRSMYDRCITRGLPGSMMPAIYGNAYQIVQTADAIAIRYEMIHETRIIPLDGRPHARAGIHLLMGDARGRFDGDTLVVETTNFTNRTHFGYNNRYNSERQKIVERFTPIAPGKLDWQVTIDDPEVWTRPWTFAMTLTKDDSQRIFEYACHEGNYGLRDILSGARAEDSHR
ncbi:MAG TPA: hypothetical protein VFP91_05755 [Vicinamibacterales bacterium]|nr:hypothetical protein [Vicinamibacterales bacterium]